MMGGWSRERCGAGRRGGGGGGGNEEAGRGRGVAKISRPPAAAAFPNEGREPEEGKSERSSRGHGVTGMLGEGPEGRRMRLRKWRKKRNGDCTQQRWKRAF